MQDGQVQLFRPPILIRRPCAGGVMEWAFCFGLSRFFVCHICLSVVGDVSETPPLTRSPLRKKSRLLTTADVPSRNLVGPIHISDWQYRH